MINLLGMKGVFQFKLPVSILAYLAGLSRSCNIVEPMLAAKFPHPLSIVFLGVHIVRRVGERHKIVRQTDSGLGIDA